jgi:hypothetical protein
MFQLPMGQFKKLERFGNQVLLQSLVQRVAESVSVFYSFPASSNCVCLHRQLETGPELRSMVASIQLIESLNAAMNLKSPSALGKARLLALLSVFA